MLSCFTHVAVTMSHRLRFSVRRTSWTALALLALAPAGALHAQLVNRVRTIDPNQTTTLPNTRHSVTVGATPIAHLDSSTRLEGMQLQFIRTAAQNAALKALIADQQDPSSPRYHQWLTPAQFAARFGVSNADLSAITNWLQQQGFAVQGANASHTALTFSGTAAQVEQAFGTRLNTYNVRGESVYAPSLDLTLPTSIAAVVSNIRNLSSLRPHARLRPAPRFTSSISGNHFLAPDDVSTIYDVKALYNSGITGSGRTIAVVGQTAIATTDVTAFRSASGLSANTPTLTLVPNSGTSVVSSTSGDQDESDLDVEWSSALAPAVTINFVYTGNNANYNVFDALQYAIDQKIAPVISISYGGCESQYTTADVSTFESWFAQANAQGQTVVAASGDDAAADCDYSSKTTITSATQGLAVDLPAASPSVTGIGGAEFFGDVAAPATYWSSTNNASSGSVLQYIPEEAWNDTSSTNGLTGSGGGKSSLFGKPSWQSGTGVPDDGARDVPDLAMAASPNHDGYLYCTAGSCVNGYRDASSNLTVAGGTSFGAPTFAALLTLVEQQANVKGLGNINPTLYAIGKASTTAFHDITTGNNIVPCTAGTKDCPSSGSLGYSTGTGYDQVTGWGTPDAVQLATAFAAQSTTAGGALAATTTALSTSAASAAVNQSITFTASVSSNGATGTPTGTVQFAVDGTNSGSPVALASGAASFITFFAAIGSHTITATYSGDATFAASSASYTQTVNVVGRFTLNASNVTVSQGATGTSTITITPSGGYTGTLSFTATANITNACYTTANATVASSTAVTTTLTIYTNASSCTATGRVPVTTARLSSSDSMPDTRLPITFGGLLPLLCLGLPVTGRRRAHTLLLMGAAGTLLVLSGCGDGGSSTSTLAPKGTYSFTVTGTDINQQSATTTFTVTVN